jgi:Mitochondrial carrier protein
MLTGLSIGLVEATLTCPIERIKVYFMTTSDIRLSYREFFKTYRGKLSKELFRGFTPLFVRQSISWSVFLQTDLAIKGQLRKFYGIAPKDPIPTSLLIPASFEVALINTAIVMPLDCVKTHMEKVDPTSTYLQTFSNIYRQGGGFYAFFTGYRLRFMLHLTNALFAVNFLEKLEHIAKKMKK